MKKLHYLVIGLCLLVSACSQVMYFGDTLPATTSVDVFYSAHDVTRQYKVIGHLNCGYGPQDQVKKYLTNYAKKIGADAIVITGSTVTEGTKSGSDVINADALKYTN
jgi:hypothetical protein